MPNSNSIPESLCLLVREGKADVFDETFNAYTSMTDDVKLTWLKSLGFLAVFNNQLEILQHIKAHSIFLDSTQKHWEVLREGLIDKAALKGLLPIVEWIYAEIPWDSKEHYLSLIFSCAKLYDIHLPVLKFCFEQIKPEVAVKFLDSKEREDIWMNMWYKAFFASYWEGDAELLKFLSHHRASLDENDLKNSLREFFQYDYHYSQNEEILIGLMQMAKDLQIDKEIWQLISDRFKNPYDVLLSKDGNRTVSKASPTFTFITNIAPNRIPNNEKYFIRQGDVLSKPHVLKWLYQESEKRQDFRFWHTINEFAKLIAISSKPEALDFILFVEKKRKRETHHDVDVSKDLAEVYAKKIDMLKNTFTEAEKKLENLRTGKKPSFWFVRPDQEDTDEIAIQNIVNKPEKKKAKLLDAILHSEILLNEDKTKLRETLTTTCLVKQ